jgi:dihydroxyacetone kinase-like protein
MVSHTRTWVSLRSIFVREKTFPHRNPPAQEFVCRVLRANALARDSQQKTLKGGTMKKILNDPNEFVVEMLDGLLKAHPNMLSFAGNDPHCIVRANSPVEGKVALATGGGSGHLPVFLGYVGEGLLDGCAVGDVFSSPSADQMLEVTKHIHGGKGVLYIYGNYGGDVMNFDMAAEMAEFEDIEVRTVLVREDVASAPPEEAERRRGVAGMVFAFKIAGAKAASGGSLDEVEETTRKALDNIRTMGVALSSCTVPAAGRPTFTIGEDEMEIGMGIHGEPGVKREKLQTADEITERMASAILADMPLQAGDRLAVLINGLGATPPEELYILYRKTHDILTEKGVQVHRAYVGEYATSMEMAGASLTFFRLDDELAALLDYPAQSPFFVQL